MIDHPLLAPFTFQDARREAGFHINCIGAKARSYFPDDWFDITDRLLPNEEALEWLDLFEAVQTAGDCATIVDLGAGYGRWLVNAALAARQLGKAYYLVGVEAETSHYAWMLEHFADNGVLPHEVRTISSAISDERRSVFFTDGHAQGWYGQAIVPTEDYAYGAWEGSRVVELAAIAAREVFDGLGLVDAVHIDLQGEETRVVPSLMSLLNDQVRRVHIGTHSDEIHAQIGDLFLAAGWMPRRIAPFRSSVDTEIGRITVNDGLQSWRNSRFK